MIDGNVSVGGLLSANRLGSQARNQTHLKISSNPEIPAIFNPMPDPIRPPRRICLVRLSALGDVCLVVPIISNLKLDGQYVALIAFGVAALHLKARDRWIGWSPRQRARRLGLVVNNSRFLVLPEREKLPNLASRVLGLVLRRLSDDWLKLHGKPILVVETFVDETRYRGTCYKACGFVAIGATAGFARSSRDFYTEHGKPKQLFVRELHPRGCALLRQARLPEPLADYETTVAGHERLVRVELAALRVLGLASSSGHGAGSRWRLW